MAVVAQEKDALTLDDLEVLIMLHRDISKEVKQQYLRLIEKLRAQLKTRKDLNGEML